MKGKTRPYLSCGYSTPHCFLISSITLIILARFLKRNNCTLLPAFEQIPRHRIRLEIKSRPLILGTYESRLPSLLPHQLESSLSRNTTCRSANSNKAFTPFYFQQFFPSSSSQTSGQNPNPICFRILHHDDVLVSTPSIITIVALTSGFEASTPNLPSKTRFDHMRG